ncbi:membrane protein [Streptomyces sp. FR-008]|nr:membrane protein [Streptomyces sp. FR-008]
MGRLLGAHVAPPAGRAERSPADGTLQHRHPAPVRTCGNGAALRQGCRPGRRRHRRALGRGRTGRRRDPRPGHRDRFGRRPVLRHAPGTRGARAAAPHRAPAARAGTAGGRPRAAAGPRPPPRPAGDTARARRSKVLARRRRTTMLLFLAFTLGAVAAAVGGLALLWAPTVPAILLSAYIAYLRRQERRRFVYAMDRRQAEAAAQHLRERGRTQRHTAEPADEADEPAPAPDPERTALAADRRALVEQTDHAEWVDQQRARRLPADGESWDPVPVPLPTYVTAPVAPRATPPVDLGAPDTWSSARSSAAPDAGGEAPRASPRGARRSRPGPPRCLRPPLPRTRPHPPLRPVRRGRPPPRRQRMTPTPGHQPSDYRPPRSGC